MYNHFHIIDWISLCFDINQDLKFKPMNFEASRRLRLRFPIEFTISKVNKLLLKQIFLGFLLQPEISGKLIWISFWPYLTLYVHSLQTRVRFQLKKMLLFTQDTWWRQCRMFLGFSAAAIEDVVSNWLALNVMFILIIDFQLRPFSWDDLRHTSFSFHRQHTEKYKRTQQFIYTEYAPSSPSSEMFELSLFLKLVNFCFSIFYWNYF